jgi:hypothetical protein
MGSSELSHMQGLVGTGACRGPERGVSCGGVRWRVPLEGDPLGSPGRLWRRPLERSPGEGPLEEVRLLGGGGPLQGVPWKGSPEESPGGSSIEGSKGWRPV